MEAVDFDEYLAALLHAPRPHTGVLAFYDHRVGRICADQRLLLLPLDDHLCLRGDGLFESLACRERTVFALDGHLVRLREGAAALRLRPPCSWEEVRARIMDVARASGRDDCGLRVLLGRGPGGFGIAPSECPVSSLYIVALESAPTRREVLEKGLSAFASAIPPKQPYLARIKSNNYLPNVLMAQEAAERGLDVAVAFDGQGRMCEAAIASVGIVDEAGALVCPPPERPWAAASPDLWPLCCARKCCAPCSVREPLSDALSAAGPGKYGSEPSGATHGGAYGVEHSARHAGRRPYGSFRCVLKRRFPGRRPA